MTENEVLERYKKLGLKATKEKDAPNKHYRPHSHGSVYLYVLKGSIKIRLDNGKWQNLIPGQEIVIGEDQVHEAIVGSDGWEYIHATKNT